MKKRIYMIEESLSEFSKRGAPKKVEAIEKPRNIEDEDEDEKEDNWYKAEDDEEEVEDIDVDTSDMADTDTIDVKDEDYSDELQTALTNEIKILEINRSALTFRIKSDPDKLHQGIPMAKLSGGEAFLFKLEDKTMKKVMLKDIILENENKCKKNRAHTIDL